MTIEQTRLKEARISRNLTQTQLAEKLNLSQQAYQRLEAGATTDMRISTLKNICKTLSISSDWLLGLTYEIEN